MSDKSDTPRTFKSEAEWIHHLVSREAALRKHIEEIASWVDAYDMRGARLAVSSYRAEVRDGKV